MNSLIIFFILIVFLVQSSFCENVNTQKIVLFIVFFISFYVTAISLYGVWASMGAGVCVVAACDDAGAAPCWLQRPHGRTQLGPAAKMVVPFLRDSLGKKGGHSAAWQPAQRKKEG